jgi:hypothetical protein
MSPSSTSLRRHPVTESGCTCHLSEESGRVDKVSALMNFTVRTELSACSANQRPEWSGFREVQPGWPINPSRTLAGGLARELQVGFSTPRPALHWTLPTFLDLRTARIAIAITFHQLVASQPLFRPPTSWLTRQAPPAREWRWSQNPIEWHLKWVLQGSRFCFIPILAKMLNSLPAKASPPTPRAP